MSWTPVNAADPSPFRDMCLRHWTACPRANSSGGWPGRFLDSGQERERESKIEREEMIKLLMMRTHSDTISSELLQAFIMYIVQRRLSLKFLPLRDS